MAGCIGAPSFICGFPYPEFLTSATILDEELGGMQLLMEASDFSSSTVKLSMNLMHTASIEKMESMKIYQLRRWNQ